MSDVLPFFDPSNRDFHPEMTHSILSRARKFCEIRGISFQEVITEDSHVAEIGVWLPRMQLPQRSILEVRQELLRQQARWNRVIELKNIEAGLGFPTWINTDSTEITMLPKAYALHIQVIFNILCSLHFVRFICSTTDIIWFSICHIQYYPEDAKFFNRSIKHFAWMNKLFGPVRGGLYRPNTYAYALVEATYDEYGDDDFMSAPVKPKGKSVASLKARRTSTSEAKSTSDFKTKTTIASDENSCDDFTPRSAARFKAIKAKCNAASKGKRLFD
jgi:hypothetical protein